MQYIAKITIFFLCILIIAPLSANEREIEEFLTLIGVKKQVELYPQLLSIYVQFNPNISVVLNNKAYKEKVSEIVENSISSMEYFTHVVKSFSKMYDKERIAPYQKWVKSELGEKITQMELAVSSIESAFLILAYGEVLKENPPKEKRVDLIKRIAETTGGAEQVSVTINSIAEGIYSGLKEVVEKDIYIVRPDKGDIKQGLDETLMTTFLYTYREASDKDLAAYSNILEDENTQWILTSLRGIYREMIKKVCTQIGRESEPYFGKAASELLAQINGFIYEKYRFEAGGFIAAFPKKPEKAVQTIPSEAGDIELTTYQVSYEDLGTTFFVAFSVYPDMVIENQSPYEVLDNSVASMVGDGKTLLSKEKISAAGNPGYDVKVSLFNGMMFIHNKIYLVGNKLIQVMCYGPAYIADHPNLDGFFETFQLIE